MTWNKKGLATGILAIVIILFMFALTSLVALTGWNTFNDSIQGVDNSTISPDVKEKIQNNITPIFTWGDKIFVYLFIVLLISYLISSATLPAEEPIYLVIFLGILVLTTVFAMMLSNAWLYLSTLDIVASGWATMTFTNFFMKIYPLVTFIIGIAGALIFYGRKRQSGGTDVFNEQPPLV